MRKSLKITNYVVNGDNGNCHGWMFRYYCQKAVIDRIKLEMLPCNQLLYKNSSSC